MVKYQNLLRDVLNTGVDLPSRNAPVRTLHGYHIRYDLRDGFPLLTTKKIDFDVIKAELIGFIRAYDHVDDFKKLGCNIWNRNAQVFGQYGELGPIYGVQWRKWQDHTSNYEIDQLQECIDNIKKDPFSRRHVVTAWNPAELHEMCLPPCHVLFQFHVYPDGSGNPQDISLSLYQRSCDVFLGVPFNIASYSLLLHLVARITDLNPLYFIHSMGDVHLYHEHFPVAITQLERKPINLPSISIKKKDFIDDYEMDDIELHDYVSHERLRARMIA